MDAYKDNLTITIQTLQRLPLYLRYLKGLEQERVEIVSATEAAASLKLNEVLVRKDFGIVSKSRGKPKVGFRVSDLICDIEQTLGYHNSIDVALVGVGSLGKALFGYEGFEKCGLSIAVGFDNDQSIVNQSINGKRVLPTEKITEVCKDSNIHIGIIAVPANQAQNVCNKLVAGGVQAIWNFAPVQLNVPNNVLVKNENIVTSLTVLAKQLEERRS